MSPAVWGRRGTNQTHDQFDRAPTCLCASRPLVGGAVGDVKAVAPGVAHLTSPPPRNGRRGVLRRLGPRTLRTARPLRTSLKRVFSTPASPTTSRGQSRSMARYIAPPRPHLTSLDLALHRALLPVPEVHLSGLSRFYHFADRNQLIPSDTIRNAPSPAESKKLGYSRRPDYRSDWEVPCVRSLRPLPHSRCSTLRSDS